jgi:uncharacterized membrane protein
MNISNLIFAAIMGGLMSLSITVVTTLARVGMEQSFFMACFEAWSVAYPVAFFCILIYRPLSSKLTDSLVKKLDL